MTKREDPREALMWETDLRVTSEELKSYASNFPPMGVYIPRGRVKVPRIKSRRIQQIAQSARGKRNSPHLLMIRPGNHVQPSGNLPSISLQNTRDVTSRDVTLGVKRHLVPTTSSRYVIEHRANDTKTKELDPMMSQFAYPTSDVINKIPLAPTAGNLQNPLFQSVLPPPYVETQMENSRQFSEKMTPRNEITSLMTQDMAYPLGHQYYQHLSAIAAMAWSDCNQATEKLRRIYEETAHLSRTYDPFGLFSGGIPGYNPHVLSSSPALGNTASIFGSKDSALPHTDYLTARYQQLADDQKKYLNHSVVQRDHPRVPNIAVKSDYANYVSNHGNIHSDVKFGKERSAVTSQSRQQYLIPKEPLPGIALFDSQYKQSLLQPQQLPCDVTMKHTSSRRKRKIYDQPALFGTLASAEQGSLTKISRVEMPKNPNLMQSTERTAVTSQSYNNMTSYPSNGYIHGNHSRPPPYESIVPNVNPFGPEMLMQTVKNRHCDAIKIERNYDVTDTTFSENLNFCLPSVACSPTQSYPNDLKAPFPFILQK